MNQQLKIIVSPVVLVFLGLWGVLVLIDRVIIGVNYSYSVHDLEIGWFSWMLNWLTGEPRLVWYTPAVVPRILNGFVSLFINLDFADGSIKKFIWIGIILQGIFVLVCAVWFSWITRVLRIGRLEQIFLVFIFFSFPTLLVYVGHRGFYLEFWLLGLPLGLTLYATLKEKYPAESVAGVGCGFLVANYYPSLAILLSFIVVFCSQRVIVGRWKVSNPIRSVSELLPMSRTEYYIAIGLVLCVIAWVLGLSFSVFNDQSGSKDLFLLVLGGLIGWSICYFVLLVLIRWDSRIRKFVFGFLMSFVLSSSIFLPWYWHGFVQVSDQAIGVGHSFFLLWSQIVAHPWYAVIWYFIVTLSGILMLHLWWGMKGRTSVTQIYGPIVFAILGTLMVMATAGATEGSIPGSAERGLIAMAPTFAAGLIVILETTKRYWRIVVLVPVLVMSTYVVFDFYMSYNVLIKEQRFDGGVLDEALNSFMEEERDGVIVCVSEEYHSKYCSAAYAYNRYRTTTSISKLPTKKLFSNRVVSIKAQMPDHTGGWVGTTGKIRDLLLPVTQPLLVVTHGGSYRDDLVQMFLSEGLEITPFWRWWEIYRKNRGKPVTNVSPGHMFIVSLVQEN